MYIIENSFILSFFLYNKTSREERGKNENKMHDFPNDIPDISQWRNKFHPKESGQNSGTTMRTRVTTRRSCIIVQIPKPKINTLPQELEDILLERTFPAGVIENGV